MEAPGIIGSDTDSSPVRYQGNTWTNDDLLPISAPEANVSVIWI